MFGQEGVMSLICDLSPFHASRLMFKFDYLHVRYLISDPQHYILQAKA